MGCITWQRVALRTADFLISAVVVLFLLTAGAYSAYALWDNNQVYAAVDNVQGELLVLTGFVLIVGFVVDLVHRAIDPRQREAE